MRKTKKIVFASMNVDKYREFKALLSAYPDIELVPAEGLLRNAEKLSFAETYSSYEENAAAKARLANQGCHYPTLADDSGLEVAALDGKPGVRSARFASPPAGAAPFSKMEQAKANIDKVLKELAGKKGADRKARFVTVLALQIEGVLLMAKGTLEGSITEAPRGTNGFGYDSIFIPDGSQKTLAEMTEGEKNSISHRAKAVQNLMAEVKARGIVLAKP